jgi:hypothetical protein
MWNKHLNAREWLEAERIDGNEWAQELLELLDGQGQAEANAEALEDIARYMPSEAQAMHKEGDLTDFVEAVCDRLGLSDALENVAQELAALLPKKPKGAKK